MELKVIVASNSYKLGEWEENQIKWEKKKGYLN
jgi:hypothetical protein